MALDVLALFGPTGVGKTALAIAVADRIRARGGQAVAVSADALQVYRGLEVLTGVASGAEQARLEHRLVSFLPVTETCTAGRYAALAHAEIDGLLAEGVTPIVVGGTGLYLRAALAELDLRPPPPPELRAELAARLAAEGAPALHAELTQVASEAAAGVAPTDGHRIVRLLELARIGAPLAAAPRAPTAAGAASTPAPSQLWTSDTRHPTRLVGCVREREELDRRIDARVAAMAQGGAAEEVRAAEAAGASATARAALGFKELLAGDVELMQRRTRRYARRQLTWMRKLPDVELIDLTGRDPEDVAAQLLA